MRFDLHTHYYPAAYFDAIRTHGVEFAFGADPTGRTIITYQGARFFGITPPMTEHLLGSIDRAVSSIEALDIPSADKARIFSGTTLSILNNV